jgi:hypothetical protein
MRTCIWQWDNNESYILYSDFICIHIFLYIYIHCICIYIIACVWKYEDYNINICDIVTTLKLIWINNVCTHTYMYLYLHIWIPIVYTYMSVYIDINIHIDVCIYIYIRIYIFQIVRKLYAAEMLFWLMMIMFT